jgi:hypothetical protein
VTPEAEEHLEKARETLVKARGLLEVMDYRDEAARAAYLAGFMPRKLSSPSAPARSRRAIAACAAHLPGS